MIFGVFTGNDVLVLPLKTYVKNHARPEGCIAERYLAEECMKYCSEYIKEANQISNRNIRNEDFEQVTQTIAYYGVLSEIIVLDYHTFQIPSFKCDWASTDHGVKVIDGFTLVNLHQFQNEFEGDPFILASQASQVFYSRENHSSNWYAVLCVLFYRKPFNH